MAFRIAISGLRAATADLDVTGNNIANNTTTGFKASRAQFADIYAVSSLGGSQQVQLTAVAQQFNQGNVSFTDNSLDLAISGEGFFVLDDGGTQIYSRAGAFGLDKNGFITNASGHTLVAFQAAAGAVTGATGPLQLSTANIPPQASTAVTVGVIWTPAPLYRRLRSTHRSKQFQQLHLGHGVRFIGSATSGRHVLPQNRLQRLRGPPARRRRQHPDHRKRAHRF